ncbi:hypothetical protein V7S43_010552 [Phytophthora oleae]|uniref:alkylglycerone-phosphate synthase n=1 Tax=Phytophthora oleae TaxID=2107226 RepID=A0ABD3FBT4_9STRA
MSEAAPSVARMRSILCQISAGGRPLSSSPSPASPPLALSPTTRWNGWGFQDTKLFVNSNKVIAISGARYAEVFANAPDRTLPSLLPWAEKRLGLDADRGSPPSVTCPEELRLQNILDEAGETYKRLLQFLHLASEEIGMRTSTTVEERVRHGHGQTCEDVFRLRHVRDVDRVPDAVVWPTSHEQVEILVKGVTQKFADYICIIPFGGGTNVTNALECNPKERRAIVSLDLGEMRRILSVDRENMTAVVEAGITGLDLHERLRHRGLTLGHEPDSWEFSTLGGWVATRASGMKKNTYGNIEDLVVNITTVTPLGTMQKAANVPRAAMGPDMNHAMLGSEGIFGVHTLVTLRLREFPDVQVYDSLIFPSLEHGLAALKEITRAGCVPASLRLMDNTQFQLGQALKTSSATNKFTAGVLDFAKKTYVTKIRGFDVNEMCAATVLLEGNSQQVAEQQKLIQTIGKRHAGMAGGEENGKRGYFFTYIIAYLRDFAMDYYFMSESFETAVPWTNARQLITDIKLAINSVAATRGVKVPPLIACRISQVYDTGVCVYVYYGINYFGVKEPMTLFHETELAAVDAIVRNGGALSHHHGVGKHRLAWLPQAVSPPAIAAIQGIKTALDPTNVFAVTNLQPSKNLIEDTTLLKRLSAVGGRVRVSEMQRKQFTLNAPPQLSTFTDDLNDYVDDEEEYEGVDGDALDQFQGSGDSDDDSSVLAEQLGNYLGGRSPVKSPDVDEKLLDLLQQRLFTPTHHDQVDIKESPRRRKCSTTSSLEDLLSDRTSRQKTMDQEAQRALLDTLSQEPAKAPSLSPQRVAQMNTRFRMFEEKKARKLTAKRRETEESFQHLFAPAMNNKSRQLASRFPKFAERQKTLLAKKRQQRVKLDQQREEELTRDRAIDLQESVRTPCICSHGNTSRSENCVMSAERDPSPSKVVQVGTDVSVDGVRHTQACMRFMTMCSKMNTSFAIQRKKDLMRRSLDDIIAFQEGKKQRQQARAAIEKAKEKETTFTPQINAKSEKIYAALIRSGKLDSELGGRMFKPRKTPPLPPKLTFQPTISKKSKWLLKKKQRELEVDALVEEQEGLSRPTSPLHLDVFSRLQQLSHHRDTEALRLQRKREEEALRAKPPVEWNVIPYDASCRFILQGFDRPNALS